MREPTGLRAATETIDRPGSADSVSGPADGNGDSASAPFKVGDHVIWTPEEGYRDDAGNYPGSALVTVTADKGGSFDVDVDGDWHIAYPWELFPVNAPIPFSLTDEAGEVLNEQAATDQLIRQPPHYTRTRGGVECNAIASTFNFNLGNVTKYIWRADLKGSRLEDLKKARQYLDFEIAAAEAGE